MLLIALVPLIVGSAFPMSELGDARAFEGRWVVIGQQNVVARFHDFALEGYAIRTAPTQAVGSDLALINPKGRVVRIWKEPAADKAVGFVREWLIGSSLAPDSIAADPRMVVGVLPKPRPVLGWMDAIGNALGVRFPKAPIVPISSKGLLVLFLASRGPVDALYRERIVNAAAKCSSVGIDVIGLFPGKDETVVALSRMTYPFNVAVDKGNGFADAFRATSTPEAFLLDASLRVVYTGAIDSSSWGAEGTVPYLLDAINALARAQSPVVRQTMPFGTNIER